MNNIIVEDRSKKEFQLSGYYYSKLVELLNKIGSHYIAHSPEEWKKGNVIIFNYPEERFKENEIQKIDELVKNGKRIILLGYYADEDGVCGVINDVSKEYGIKLLKGCVEDKDSCDEIISKKDEKMVVTTKIYDYNINVRKICVPYCAPLSLKGEAKLIAESEKGQGMIAQYKEDSNGEIIVSGSCVFCDNFSIRKCDNEKFTINLLTKTQDF